MVFLRMCDRLALTRTNIQVLEKKTYTYRRTPDQTVFNPLFSKKTSVIFPLLYLKSILYEALILKSKKGPERANAASHYHHHS